eukprot:9499393-Pyramimonas_sp.AAC.1
MSKRRSAQRPLTTAHQIGQASGSREVDGQRFCQPFRARQLRSRCRARPCPPSAERARRPPAASCPWRPRHPDGSGGP